MGLSLVCAGALSCSADALPARNLGATSDELAAEATPAARSALFLEGGALDPFIVGRWVGRAEDAIASDTPSGERPVYSFPSGSTEIILDLAVEDIAEPTGSITFGAGSLPEPVQGVGFPPEFNYFISFRRGHQLPPIEGFAYALNGAPIVASAPQFGGVGAIVVNFQQNEPYGPWCALHPPEPARTASGFSCVGYQSITGTQEHPDGRCQLAREDGTEVEVGCDFLSLCEDACYCTERRCFANPDIVHQLWLIREGDALIGSFVGAVFDYGAPGSYIPVNSVRFERASD